MYRFLSVGNLLWLVWSAVTVEVTLNLNHVSGVLGGRHDGELQLPGQLLPFLVGLFSFIRTCYQLLTVKLAERVEGKDGRKNTSDSDSTVIVMPGEYSPARLEEYGTQQLALRPDGYHVVAHSLATRLLVGWLPWLGLVVHPSTASRSRLSLLVERGTGLSGVSVEDKQRDWQSWTNRGGYDSPGAFVPQISPLDDRRPLVRNNRQHWGQES